MPKTAIVPEPPDFSLVMGGPLYQLFRRAHLTGSAMELLVRRMLLISLLAWLPLLALSAFEGHLMDGNSVSFLRDIESHVRFLVALPALIYVELIVHQRITPVVKRFLERGVVTPEETPKYYAAIDAALRARNSVWLELALVVFVYTFGHWIWRHEIALDAATWYAVPDATGIRLTLAGYWLGFISIPIFQFILLRWYLRLGMWFQFLWRVSRLKLRLTPTHPDHAGGIGFLGRSSYAFGPILFAQGAMLAGLIASRILYHGESLKAFKMSLGALVVFFVLVILGPLTMFTPHLSRAKDRGLNEFGILATEYAADFDAKWFHGGAKGEAVLGTADIQSLADLGNSYATENGDATGAVRCQRRSATGRRDSRTGLASVSNDHAARGTADATDQDNILRNRQSCAEELLMKYVIVVALICSLICPTFAQDPGWPREKSNAEGSIIYYQPQLDEWKNFKLLEARMAVSIRPKGGQPTVGVIHVQATTDANTDTRNVLLSNVQITETKFPSLDAAGSAAMDKLVRTFLAPGASINISLDRLLADMEVIKNPPPSGAAVKNDPPKIFVSYQNSILLLVEGEPVRVPIEKSSLEFVVNTNWGLFFDKSASKFYLLNEKQWLTSAALEGPWTATTKLPKEMSNLPDQPNWADVKKAIPPAATTGGTPKVFYSTTPAEIISFKGQPKYAKIPGTQLSYATNTESNLFLQSGDNQYYFLVAGRWFRAKSLDGPWTFATADLPADFAKIPASSPAARVLASVPGTNEAEDAVLLAQVPTTVIVDRAKAEAEVKVEYDGPPEFKPIESTSMSYATNTADKIVKVGDLYYLCFQGVWFMSTKPDGPWKTADSVPKEIYTIPASSPVYNITYVTQTTTSSGETEASSTAGYLGMFIIGAAVGATLAYGSGYYYPPYYYYGRYPYPIYRPYPVTYGVGAFYNPYNGAYGYARGAYGPYGGVAGGAWYNPSTGTYGRAAGGCNAYGCAGGARAYNPYTGAYGATRQGSNAYSQWGSSVVTKGDKWAQTGHYSDSRGTVAGARTSEGGRVVAGSGQNGSGFVGQSGSGDVYAGKDGNVYKKTSNGWQQYDNGGWNSVNSSGANSSTKSSAQAQTNSAQSQRAQNAQSSAANRQPSTQPAGGQANSGAQRSTQPSASPSTSPSPSQRPAGAGQSGGSSQVSDLNREAQARQTGSQRTQNYERQSRSSSGGAARTSGGGSRSRGGRR